MRTLFIALFALVVAQECHAQSSVHNGDFRADLSHWTIRADLPNAVLWTQIDRDDSAHSGSAHFLADAPCIPIGPNAYSCPAPALAQCVSIQPNRSYRAFMSGLIPSGPDQRGFIQLAITPYNQDNCTGSILLFRTAGIIPSVSAWQDTSVAVPSLAGSRSALVEIAVFRDTSRSETFHAYVDRVSLTDTSLALASVPLSPLTHFTLAVLLACAGLVRVARAP